MRPGVTVAVPYSVAPTRSRAVRVALTGAIVAGVAIGWLACAVSRGAIATSEWPACAGVLGAYGLAMLGATAMLRWLGIPAVGAAALSVTLGLFWLSWPVWLSAVLTDLTVRVLVPLSPVLAINGEFDRPNAKTHRMKRELANFQAVVLPGKSHLTAIMAGYIPREYIDTLVRFINDNDRP